MCQLPTLPYIPAAPPTPHLLPLPPQAHAEDVEVPVLVRLVKGAAKYTITALQALYQRRNILINAVSATVPVNAVRAIDTNTQYLKAPALS